MSQPDVVDALLSLKHCNVNLGTRVLPLHAAVIRTDESLINRLAHLGADLNKVSYPPQKAQLS